MNNFGGCKHYSRDVRDWIASDDIVMHEETCRDCGKSVYRKWHYNDGFSTPNRDMDTRVDYDYRPVMDAAPEVSERSAVDEVIADEKLTVDEIVRRMPEGWTIIAEKHFNMVVKQKNDNQAQITKLEKIMKNRRLSLLDAAMRLAGYAGMTHRDKDEQVLMAMHKILSVALVLDDLSEGGDIDEIPF